MQLYVRTAVLFSLALRHPSAARVIVMAMHGFIHLFESFSVAGTEAAAGGEVG